MSDHKYISKKWVNGKWQYEYYIPSSDKARQFANSARKTYNKATDKMADAMLTGEKKLRKTAAGASNFANGVSEYSKYKKEKNKSQQYKTKANTPKHANAFTPEQRQINKKESNYNTKSSRDHSNKAAQHYINYLNSSAGKVAKKVNSAKKSYNKATDKIADAMMNGEHKVKKAVKTTSDTVKGISAYSNYKSSKKSAQQYEKALKNSGRAANATDKAYLRDKNKKATQNYVNYLNSPAASIGKKAKKKINKGKKFINSIFGR